MIPKAHRKFDKKSLIALGVLAAALTVAGVSAYQAFVGRHRADARRGHDLIAMRYGFAGSSRWHYGMIVC